jgi:hypothetical protein
VGKCRPTGASYRYSRYLIGGLLFFEFFRFVTYQTVELFFQIWKQWAKMKLLVHRCSSLSCFLCVARAFLLFIKVLVLLSWDLTRDCKRAFQHVNNNENKKASVPIHSIQPYGLLFSVGDISEKLKEWCARVFSLLRFYLLGQQQKDLFKNSTWIKFPWVQNSLLRRIPALGPLH